LILALVVSQSHVLASAALTNLGILNLRDSLLETQEIETWGCALGGTGSGDLADVQQVKRLQHAVELDENRLSSQWVLLRAALAAGIPEAAIDSVNPLRDRVDRNPLLYIDVLKALSRCGQARDVISFYDAIQPPEPTQAVSDTVALAYIDLARAEERGKELLCRAMQLRPADLSVHYGLLLQARQVGDLRALTAHNEALNYFSKSAVDPTDERLLGYVAEVVPKLLEQGLWQRDKATRVVSYLVWQHSQARELRELLDSLVERYPDDPHWHFYLGEFHHRRGDLAQAKTEYQEVVELEPSHTQAYLRLGRVAEGACDENPLACASQAAKYYSEYHTLVPNDVMGLKHLASACSVLERAGVSNENCSAAARRSALFLHRSSGTSSELGGSNSGGDPGTPAATLRAALVVGTDDRYAVAESLGVQPETVSLGPNLLSISGAEVMQGGSLWSWKWSGMCNREPFGRGLFVGGVDRLDGDDPVRITGVWEDAQRGERPRAGFWYRDTVALHSDKPVPEGERTYVLSFDYRTAALQRDSSASVHGVETRAEGFVEEKFLTETHGVWSHMAIVGVAAEPKLGLRPLFRLFGEGHVWFDNISLRAVQ
jgi:tetratricopeptide (TPR) repeat protein